MALQIYERQIIEGEDLTLPIKWTIKETGAAVDLTGSTIFFDAKRPEFDRFATITNATEGEYTFSLSAADTDGKVTTGGEINLDYLVKHTNGSGEVNYIYRIKIKVVGANE